METRRPTDLEITTYLSFFQNMIARMSTNSMQCKLGCVTLSAALLAVYSSKIINQSCTIVFFMILIQILFALMDAIYIYFERDYREQFEAVVKKYKENALSIEDLYEFSTPDTILNRKYLEALCSWSVGPLYLLIVTLGVTVLIVANFGA